MSDTASLKIEIDYAQERVRSHFLTVLAEGSYPGYNGDRISGWDKTLSVDLWQDPVTWTAFPLPNVFDPTWNTTVSGNYARYGIADLDFTNSSKWKADATALAGDNWLSGDNLTADETVSLKSALSANTPVWIAGFAYSAESERFVDFECGWSDGKSLSAGVGLRRYSNGDIEVWKGGAIVGTYKLGGEKGNGDANQQFSGLALLPCRKRELLVVTRGLSGFTHSFEDLDEDDASPTITPAEKFWVKFPVAGSGPRTAKLQLAKIVPKSSMTAISRVLQFPDPPEADQLTQSTKLYSSAMGASLTASIVKEDGSTAFTADGTAVKCRMKVAVSGVTKMTGLYGALGAIDGVLTTTPDDAFDLAPYVTEASLRVPENGSPAEMSITVARLDEFQNEEPSFKGGISGLKAQSNRPVKIGFGSQVLIGGRTGNPRTEIGFDDSVTTVSVECFDRWRVLERFVFRDKIPLQGYSLTAAIKLIVQVAITDSPARFQIDPLADSFTVPEGGSPSVGDWGFTIEPGERASDALERLMEAFAGDWFYGFVPDTGQTVFRATAPANLPTTPDVTLYLTHDEAVAALEGEGLSTEQAIFVAPGRICMSYRQEVIPPEATEVRVTGWDPRKGESIQAVHREPGLEDPEVLPGEWPDGWQGEKLLYGYADPAIQTQSVCNSACDALANRLTRNRVIAEVSCNLLFKSDLVTPVWRGDCVAIDGIGSFRVTSMQGSFVKDYSDEDTGFGQWVWRPFTYTLELIDADHDGWRAATRGCGLGEIRTASDRARVSRQRFVRGGEKLLMVGGIIAVERP